MKNGFYPKLAWSGIKKNKQLYLPYLLTCAGMVMMFYIISFLANSSTLSAIRGGDLMQAMFSLGQWVIGIFALIFLFYTNSFLIRKRKKEFGLFNILGMGKWNIARILSFECLIIFAISLTGGLFCGILFSKLSELFMINLLQGDINFSFTISTSSVSLTITLFAVIFLLLLLNGLRQIHTANPIELLHSENTGEKPPKANWILALLGSLILGYAYDLAVTISDPVSAMIWFFAAVVMVIIATYILFISGSVALCRLLQKKKSYYYKTRHFVSVSSMMYRMKRNGAGLASICILATMVLVMISSTVCLYIGKEDSVKSRYPRSIITDTASADPSITGKIQETVDQVLSSCGIEPQNSRSYTLLSITGTADDNNRFVFDIYNQGISGYAKERELLFVSLSDYNQLTGGSEILGADEVLMYVPSLSWCPDTLTLNEHYTVKVKKMVPEFVEEGAFGAEIISTAYIIVPDINEIKEILSDAKSLLYPHHYYEFDLNCSDELQIEIRSKISAAIRELQLNDSAVPSVSCDSAAKERADFYSLYSGLFFLGILLGIVFLFATVLIMYYKQISEGYEDQSRFEIMQKVGMTKTEIRQSINSQILTVFFLPLIFAGIHLAFAFPLISKLLVLFNVTNSRLLITVTIACYLIFALFYVIVYQITSRTYYHLVSSVQDKKSSF